MVKFEERGLSHNEALTWLNDWCGRRVLVAGRLRGVLIFEAEGELRHSADVGDAGRAHVEDYNGRYCVASALTSFKVTDPALPASSFRVTDLGPGGADTGEALTIALDDHVVICVTRLRG